MRTVELIVNDICIWREKDDKYGPNINIDCMLRDLDDELESHGYYMCKVMGEPCHRKPEPCEECHECII